jgi:hypothetical protein
MNLIDKKFTSTDLAARNRYYEQQQLIGYWAKKKGISLSAIEQHPYADDVVLLLNMRDSAFWHLFNSSEQAIWGAYWNVVYHNKRKLKEKALNKLEQIILTATQRQDEQAQKRQKIKALRTQWNAKSGGYMMANAPDAAIAPISNR